MTRWHFEENSVAGSSRTVLALILRGLHAGCPQRDRDDLPRLPNPTLVMYVFHTSQPRNGCRCQVMPPPFRCTSGSSTPCPARSLLDIPVTSLSTAKETCF